MFLFYHNQQTSANAHNYKGQLFEKLMKRYLDAVGYDVELNQIKNSLEYDIEGIHRTNDFRLLGEAKAEKRKQDKNPLTHFCAKYIPEKMRDKRLSGLFLSITPISKEAEDYYNSLSDLNLDLDVCTGKKLFDRVRKELRLPEPYTLSRQIEERSLFPHECYMLTTEQEIFLVQFAAESQSATTSLFALFRENGTLLSDYKYSELLSENISELSGLEAIIDTNRSQINNIDYKVDKPGTRTIPKGLSVSKKWTDYRLPAAPDFFVGRQILVNKINGHLQSSDKSHIIQIKSRSGVGKSSFLAYINSKFQKQGYIIELHDARNIKSVIHLFSVIQRFTGFSLPPSDMREAEQQLQRLANKLKIHQFAIFMVDQFESTFSNYDLFNAYEDLIQIFSQLEANIFLFIARKSDLLTTYDEREINLGVIKQLSQEYELQDLSSDEAAELINKISEHSIKPIKNDLKAYVYEIAQGFPWLIKRTMNHIIDWFEKHPVIQGDFFDTGLGLDDLFNEELEGLDELDRDYLTKMAQHLPATRQQLERLFNEDHLLSKIIDKLVHSRLLRLEGSTCDIYNDVFKDFLVHQKLPELRRAFMYRLYPKQVIKNFNILVHKFGYNQQFSESDLRELFTNKDTKSHNVKEIRNVGLLKKSSEFWIIPKIVQDVSEQNNLGEYVRKNLINNTLIQNILEESKVNENFLVSNLSDYLKNRFIFTKASDKTWVKYANILKKWMTEFYICEIINDKFISPNIDRSKITKRLGNLDFLISKSSSNHK
ncbi:hypothetical protein NWP22_03900 [Anabaenopsis tanganyikae CS-531]|uniref:Novel STAND NTPase 1 domain-containing protein n=1 Tax=Anabaenopsis tanganyikae CS-531 TaxID=2785304 RepID=A0ABT6KC43_9CYAN|nr:hypothetical protein [Anabaenopsis tanganyikae]MDH6105021.1 hypothetical protein [Anabaenopsis tanganyikae CS-531]